MGCQLDCDPHAIEFKAEEWGKPFVVGHSIQFSASSSHEYGLVALSTDGRVGVDIEQHNSVLASADFQFHSEEEYQAIIESSASVELFFRVWARKEACIKALGHGMRFLLSDFSVLPDLTCDRCTANLPEPVTVCDLSVAVGYSAAVAWHVKLLDECSS